MRCLMEAAAKIVIGQKAKLIRDGHPLGACIFALIAHAAIK